MKKELNEATILVVEDERPLAEAIAKKLDDGGFNVLSARTVDQALEYMYDKDIPKIDAVWLDHYLFGEKTGLDFLAGCRKDEKCKKVPIFVVTNTGGHEKEQTYMELGASKYYIKSNHRLDVIIADIKKKVKA